MLLKIDQEAWALPWNLARVVQLWSLIITLAHLLFFSATNRMTEDVDTEALLAW
jgi:hypothetical protein